MLNQSRINVWPSASDLVRGSRARLPRPGHWSPSRVVGGGLTHCLAPPLDPYPQLSQASSAEHRIVHNALGASEQDDHSCRDRTNWMLGTHFVPVRPLSARIEDFFRVSQTGESAQMRAVKQQGYTEARRPQASPSGWRPGACPATCGLPAPTGHRSFSLSAEQAARLSPTGLSSERNQGAGSGVWPTICNENTAHHLCPDACLLLPTARGSFATKGIQLFWPHF